MNSAGYLQAENRVEGRVGLIVASEDDKWVKATPLQLHGERPRKTKESMVNDWLFDQSGRTMLTPAGTLPMTYSPQVFASCAPSVNVSAAL